MEHSKLIEALNTAIRNLKQDKLGEIDFARLREDLTETVATLKSLSAKADLAERLLEQFRAELMQKARANARLSGASSDLVERMIQSESSSLEELLQLKQEIETEFDRVFSRNLAVPTGAAGGGEKLAEFKI